MIPLAPRTDGDLDRPADPRRAPSAPLQSRRFGILGVDVRLSTDDPQVDGFFRHAYRWFPPDEGGRPLELAALLGPAAQGRPRAVAGRREVDLTRSPSPANQAFLVLLGAIMDAVGGSLMFHGAAVSHGGRGIILAGPAFAGKSTLVLALMERGCRFLSDDAAPVDRETGLLHPFPRAVGVRKGGETAAGLDGSGEGRYELPHRWLVDPEAMGASLPAAACRPALLFYLDPAGWSSGSPSGEVTYDVVTAGDPGRLRAELRQAGALEVHDEEARPFPTLSATFPTEGGTVGGLIDLQRRHRDTILFLEQRRPPAPRPGGPPVIEEAPLSALLIPLVRDLLNRGDEGLLMSSHKGSVASLMVEAASLLAPVRCYRISRGSPGGVADTIMTILRSGADR